MKKNIGIMGSDGKSLPIEEDPDFNLAMSEEVVSALDEKCERVKQLEKFCEDQKVQYEDMRKQFEEDVEELKDMVRKFREENLRLKNLLKEHGVDYQ